MKKIIGLLLLVILTSCAEDVPAFTAGEIAGNELRAQTERLQIKTARIYEWSVLGDGGSLYSLVDEGSFSINGQFMVVTDASGNAYYNLDKLQRFSVSSENQSIDVYMK